MPLVVLWLGVAFAEMPLPSYREHLAVREWYQVNERIEAGDRRAAEGDAKESATAWRNAIADADRYQTVVQETSGLRYLQGLAWHHLGDNEQAEAAWRRSIALDETAPDAWHDLGELLLASQRYDEAEECFRRVSALVARGPDSWMGPLRQAEIAAYRHDASGFEAHAREALRRGFSFQQIGDSDTWRRFHADPALTDSIEKLVMVYGDAQTLDSLRKPGATD